MIEGFDKEINALLRQTARSETASANNNLQSEIRNPKLKVHLDADEISAFAENALPEKTKLKYTAHFADCDRCRTILANIITLNSEAETVPASSVVSPQIVETKPISWYRKLFAFPNLAYTMGALVVLFGGFIAFTVVRNLNEATGSQSISQVSESERSAGGPSFDGDTELTTQNAASNMMSNTAMSSNMTLANTASNTMMSNAASTSATNTANASTDSTSRAANANSTVAQPPRAAAPQPAPPTIAQAAPTPPAETFSTDAAGSSAARISENEKKAADRKADAEKTEAEQDAPRSDSAALSARNTTATTRNDSGSPKAKSQNRKSSGAESRQISGKTFTLKEGVWYDASYNGQTTTNVSRGSDDYKKLDSGLRSIAGSLDGTVVIVWKGKSYRVQ